MDFSHFSSQLDFHRGPGNEDSRYSRVRAKLREVTRAYPGRRKLQLVIQLSDGTSVTLDSQAQGVDINNELRNRLDELLGGGNIQMITSPPKVQNRPAYAR